MQRLSPLVHFISVICIVGASLFAAPAAHAVMAVTITVNTTELTHIDNSNCDLLEALTAASSNTDTDLCDGGGDVVPDIISFNIGTGVQTISPSGTIDVSSPVRITGAAQGGYAGTPLIKIAGATSPVLRFSTGSNLSRLTAIQVTSSDTEETVSIIADSVTLTANYINTDGASVVGSGKPAVRINGSDYSTIGGTLAADRNLIGGADGIAIDDGTYNTVQGNYFGLTSGGNALLANPPASPGYGVALGHTATTTNTTIRGNVISGGYALSGGVLLERYSSDSLVAGNIIGLGADGVTKIGNGTGVYIEGSWDNIIGGSTEADRNVISGNVHNVLVTNWVGGITIVAVNNQIAGNYIGTTADGMSRITAWGAEGSDENGILLAKGDSTTIGGDTAAHGNVIAGNDNGIQVQTAATATRILNNKVGTNKDGTAALRQETGLAVLGAAMIGDSVTPGNNVISGNDVGINVSSAVASIYNNRIGLTAEGNSPLGNLVGIVLWSSSAATIAGNWIAHNTDQGLNVQSTALVLAGSTGNCFTSNASTGVYSAVAGTPLGSSWWGVPTGPTHLGNPAGTGDVVTDNVTYSGFLTKAPAACPRAESDFDGDGRTDIAKYTPGTHLLEYLRSSTEAWAEEDMGVGTFTYVVRSDLDGDGMADPAKFVASSGSLWYLKSGDAAWDSEYLGPGTYDYLPASDFDGDGYDDPATYAAGSNVLWYLESSSGSWQGEYLGPGTYTIVPGSDFDGDGMTDPAHFNSSVNSLWYRGSSDSTWHGVYLGPGSYSFVPGSDFDGDGLTDAAHFNSTTNALWYRQSSTSTWHSLYMGAGTLTFVPAGDWDGDGLTDPAHFDTATNVAWGYFGGSWHGLWLGAGSYQVVD